MFQVHPSRSNVDNQRCTNCIHLIRPLHRIIRNFHYFLADNGTQFVSTYYQTICHLPDLKHLTTSSYHIQTAGQADGYSRTLTERLCNYMAKSQRNWDIFVQQLTYTYHTQINCSTWTTPFSLVLPRHRPAPDTFKRPSALLPDAKNATAPSVLQSKLLHLIAMMRERTDQKPTTVHCSYKDQHDHYVCPTTTIRDTRSTTLSAMLSKSRIRDMS